MSVGQRIKETREKSGLSQAALAQKLGVTQQAIQRAEKGETVKPKFLPELAVVVSVSYEYLATGIENISYSQNDNGLAVAGASVQQSNMSSGDAQIKVLELFPGGAYSGFVYKGGVADMALRPRSLDNAPKAYGVYMYDQSMAPRYMQGEMLFMHPAKPVSNGDFVAAHIKNSADPDAQTILIVQLQQQGMNTYVFNRIYPQETLRISVSEVISINKIVASSQ